MLSTGRASVGARTTNTENASFDHKTNNGDSELQSTNSKIFSQPTKDVAVLSFDVTPTVTGEVYFRQVLGCIANCCAAAAAAACSQRSSMLPTSP